jgi:hypothetical protein
MSNQFASALCQYLGLQPPIIVADIEIDLSEVGKFPLTASVRLLLSTEDLAAIVELMKDAKAK